MLVHGAATAQLALAAGVLDELELHVVPVLFGQGRRLFEGLAPERIELERTRILEGEGGVTHMHYRVRRASVNAERMIEANGVELCTEASAPCRSADPPDHGHRRIDALVGGGLLRLLAEGGRFVIRYDHRDTADRSRIEPGRPEYTGADLIADAVDVLDAYGTRLRTSSASRPEVPSRSCSRSTTPIASSRSSSSALHPRRRGPWAAPATERYQRFVSTATVDWSNETSVIEYLVDYARTLSGDARPFDEAGIRELVRRDVQRAHDIASSENHGLAAEGEGLARVAVLNRRLHAGDPRHGGSDVPARARRGAGPGDPRCTAAQARGIRARGRASRLGKDRGGHPRAHRLGRWAAG